MYQKFIFDLRFDPVFTVLDKKGQLLDLLQDSKLFEEVGIDANKFAATRNSPDVYRTITLEPHRISGNIEKEVVDVECAIELLKQVKKIEEAISLDKGKIRRVGLRFMQVYKKPFEEVNDKLISLMNNDLLKIVGGEKYIDAAIVPVVNYKEGYNVRYALGPIKQDEYSRYYKKHLNIPFNEGCFIDIDYFSESWQSQRIDKFCEDAFKNLSAKIEGFKKLFEL